MHAWCNPDRAGRAMACDALLELREPRSAAVNLSGVRRDLRRSHRGRDFRAVLVGAAEAATGCGRSFGSSSRLASPHRAATSGLFLWERREPRSAAADLSGVRRDLRRSHRGRDFRAVLVGAAGAAIGCGESFRSSSRLASLPQGARLLSPLQGRVSRPGSAAPVRPPDARAPGVRSGRRSGLRRCSAGRRGSGLRRGDR